MVYLLDGWKCKLLEMLERYPIINKGEFMTKLILTLLFMLCISPVFAGEQKDIVVLNPSVENYYDILINLDDEKFSDNQELQKKEIEHRSLYNSYTGIGIIIDGRIYKMSFDEFKRRIKGTCISW